MRAWGYVHPDDALDKAVRLLVGAAADDGGRRIGVHLADPEDMLLIAALSHGGSEPEETILPALTAVPSTTSCGTNASDDGRWVWAVLSTARPRSPSA
ncbi:hypothetical protein MIU24_13955 [Streptomyces venezuelae]|uniref:hypothetical protein n=1 Tax=Streptomyces sp. B6(2022) TaxID=3404749 RepID=UPI003120403A